MPCMPNMSNQQSYKTFTTEFVPSTAGVGRAPSPAAFDVDFRSNHTTRITNHSQRQLPGGGRGRPPHTDLQCDFEV